MVPGECDRKTLSVAVVLLCSSCLCSFFVTLCCVFFQSHDPSMFGSRNEHAARSFSTPRVFTWWRSSRLDSMEMTPEQLERLSAHLYQSIAGNVERRLEEWWQNQSGSSGKGGGGKGGHTIIEPKYLSRVTDFLGDERSWKDWFASLTIAVIQMYPHLADAMERVAVRAESIQNWNSLDDWIDGNVPDEYEGPLWAVLVQHTGGEARTVVLNQIMNQGKPDGFTALGMRAKRYNPNTPSRILHALTQVLSPPTVKDVRQAEAGSSDGGRVGSCEG